MDQSICFLLSGRAHLPYVVVALSTLRRVYSGHVTVYAYPESHATASVLCGDGRIDAECRLFGPTYEGKNHQFLNKLDVMQRQTDSKVALYLDADIIVNKPLSYLFEMAEKQEFVATQFCDWVSNTGTVKNRIERLSGREGIDQDSVRRVLSSKFPSLNGGVFACRSDSIALDTWRRWANLVKDIFICDEVVLHVVMGWYDISPPPFQRPKEFTVAEGGKWNCSPKYQPSYLKDEDVAIWHFHGDCNTRPQKSRKGYQLWWPEYKRCLEENVGGIQEWISTVGNRFLTECEQNENLVK